MNNKLINNAGPAKNANPESDSILNSIARQSSNISVKAKQASNIALNLSNCFAAVSFCADNITEMANSLNNEQSFNESFSSNYFNQSCPVAHKLVNNSLITQETIEFEPLKPKTSTDLIIKKNETIKHSFNNQLHLHQKNSASDTNCKNNRKRPQIELS